MVLSRSAPFPEQQAQLGWNQLCLALKTSQGILGHKLPYRSGVAAHSSPLPLLTPPWCLLGTTDEASMAGLSTSLLVREDVFVMKAGFGIARENPKLYQLYPKPLKGSGDGEPGVLASEEFRPHQAFFCQGA